VEVPPAKTTPSLDGPFLGYKFETYPRDVHIPFKINDRKLVIDPRQTFARADQIAVLFSVLNVTEEFLRDGEAKIEIRGLREANPVLKSFTVKLSAHPFERTMSIPQSISAAELDPDYYEITVRLFGAGGEVLDEKKDSFVVLSSPVTGHPIANAKGFPLANRFLYLYMLAQQAEKMSRADAAKSWYNEAYRLNPEYKDGVVMYGNFLNKVGAFEEALKVAETLRGDDRRQFAFFTMRGQARMGQNKFEDALKDLLQANRMYNSDTNVLNSLGRCYYRLGRKAEALDALNASLKLNPDQEAAKKLIQETGK
jgi:tetratricopeptide (TPR) repeat protein